MAEQTRERAAHLRLAETLSVFLTRLRASAETLDIVERQRIVRLVVKEVLVNDDTIVIRHCIPVPSGPPPTNDGGPNSDTDKAADSRSCLLRSGSNSGSPEGSPVPFRMTSRDDLAESGRPPGAPRGPMCREHLKRTCAPAVQPPMDAPWGVCVVERQYRDRQASGRARSILQRGGSN